MDSLELVQNEDTRVDVSDVDSAVWGVWTAFYDVMVCHSGWGRHGSGYKGDITALDEAVMQFTARLTAWVQTRRAFLERLEVEQHLKNFQRLHAEMPQG